MRHAVDAGIDFLQIRERDLEAAALADLVQEAVAVAQGSSTRVVVNDRLDVALACGAAGVHLRGDSVPPAVVRAAVPAGFVVGVSVHTLAEAVAAAPNVDYIVAGTVWPTPSKPSAAVIGPDGLSRIAAAVGVPVLAIGGVTLARVAETARAGAAGAAAIGLFMAASGDRARCRARPLRDVVEAARTAFDTPGSA